MSVLRDLIAGNEARRGTGLPSTTYRAGLVGTAERWDDHERHLTRFRMWTPAHVCADMAALAAWCDGTAGYIVAVETEP